MNYKKFLRSSGRKIGQARLNAAGQASLEYFVLLAAIGAITMIVGSSFLSRTKGASEGLFSAAVDRILDP